MYHCELVSFSFLFFSHAHLANDLNHLGSLASLEVDAVDVAKFEEIFDLRVSCDADGLSSELDAPPTFDTFFLMPL